MAKTRFLKMFYKLPVPARRLLVYGWPDVPMSLNVIAAEVKEGTKVGNELLTVLGFFDEEKK